MPSLAEWASSGGNPSSAGSMADLYPAVSTEPSRAMPTAPPSSRETSLIADATPCFSSGSVSVITSMDGVATAEIRTQTGHFTPCGEGMCVGVDGGFTGGSIAQVEFHVADDAYVDVETHLAAAFARD